MLPKRTSSPTGPCYQTAVAVGRASGRLLHLVTLALVPTTHDHRPNGVVSETATNFVTDDGRTAERPRGRAVCLGRTATTPVDLLASRAPPRASGQWAGRPVPGVTLKRLALWNVNGPYGWSLRARGCDQAGASDRSPMCRCPPGRAPHSPALSPGRSVRATAQLAERRGGRHNDGSALWPTPATRLQNARASSPSFLHPLRDRSGKVVMADSMCKR